MKLETKIRRIIEQTEFFSAINFPDMDARQATDKIMKLIENHVYKMAEDIVRLEKLLKDKSGVDV